MPFTDIAVNDTLDFLKPYLPMRGGRILDVGCGSGVLAAALVNLGYAVVAIDTKADAIREARARGVDAREADVLCFQAEAFDAIVFSRSLHHVFPLGDAIASIKRLLRPGGTLLLEEFAVDKMDAVTAAWFYATGAFLRGALAPNEDGMERWRAEHAHEPPLHTGDGMHRAVEAEFHVVYAAPAPYLYRSWLENEEVGRAFLRLEKALIAAEVIRPLGYRIVAR